MLLRLADFAPDLPAFNDAGGSANIVNAVPRTAESYGPVGALSSYSTNALAGTCLAALAVPDTSGNNYVFAADSTSLYELVPGATTFSTLNTGFSVATGEFWNITYFAPYVIAVAPGQATQKFKLGTDSAFSALGGSPPQARYCATIKQFLMLGNTYDGTNGQQTQRVQWCAISDPNTWPTAGSVTEAQTLAGSQTFPGDQGWIQGIVGNLGTSDGAIFFDRAIWRVVFAGAPDVFAFYPCEGVRGCPAPKSITQFGATVFYLGEDGFYAFDGSNSKPIGINKVDKWFFANVNLTYLYNVIAAVDPVNKVIMWAFPSTSSSSGQPDSLLLYNWALDKWGYANYAVEYIFRSVTQGYSLEQLDSFSSSLDALQFSLDSREWTGGAITIGAFNGSNGLGYFTGDALAATLDTVEIEPFSGADGGPRRRTWVSNSIPLVDGGTPAVQIGTRSRVQDSVTWTAAAALDSVGQCSVRADGQLVRARISMNAGDSWTHCKGIHLTVKPSGTR